MLRKLSELLPRRNRDAQPAPPAAEAAHPPPVADPPVPEDVVGRDGELSGWCNHATGEILPGFDAGPEDTLLDVGCGDNPLSGFCIGRAGSILLADLLHANVGTALHKLSTGTSTRLGGIVTDTLPLPIRDGSMTRIVATEVLEHVPDPVAFMAELVRVGSSGARYLLSVPDPSSEAAQAPIAAPAYFEPPNHVRVFGRDEFERLVRDAGLVIESRMLYGFYWSVWWCFFWACGQDLKPPWHPVLESWTRTWGLLLATQQGPQIKRALDAAMPKSQVIVARKP